MKAARILLGITLLLASGAWALATTVIQPTFASLVDAADYVVRAKVKSVTSEWRENPDRPGERFIGSNIELEVLEVLKGSPPTPLVLRVVGGSIGDQELRIEGAPPLQEGGESILFVQGNRRNFYPLVGLMYGYFPVKRDAQTGRGEVLRYNGRPVVTAGDLNPGAALRTSGTGMTPESFRLQVQQQNRENLARENLR